MNIVRRRRGNRFTDLDLFRDLFEEFNNLPVVEKETFEFPTMDVIEKDDEYEVDLNIPGVSKDDIKIELNDNILTVSGEKKYKKDLNEENYKVVESYYGKFERSVKLPKDVDQEKIDAKYEDGVLKIHIPKNEKNGNRLIEVK